MIVSNCPRCNEAFRVTSGELPEDAYAQCPWCRDTFPLTDVLNRLPPILEVFSADGQPIASTPQVATAGMDGEALHASSPGFGAVDPIESEAVEETIASETVTDESWDQDQSTAVGDDHFDFAVEDPRNEQLSAAMAPMKVSPIPERKKKSKSSGIGKAVGIVLGGVAALPIAFGILWAMGRLPDLGFGPFDSQADSTRKAAPPAQPTKPLGQPLSLSLSDDQQLSAEDDPAELAREQIMGQPQADEPVVADGKVGVQSRLPIVLPAEETQTSDAENQAAQRTPPGEESPLPSDSKANRGVGEQQTASTLQVPASAAQEEESPALPTSSDRLTMPDLSAIPAPTPVDESAEMIASADRAGRMIEAVSIYDGPEEERNRQLLLTYEQIAITCGLATDSSDALRTLATKIRESSIVKDIERKAAGWLIYSSRNSEGIALIGRPGSQGDGQIITLESGEVVSVVGDTPLPSAEKIIAMGKIVDGGSSVELVLVEALP